MTRLGTPIGLLRRATIRKYNNDGTVQVALDEIALAQNKIEFRASLPVAWTGPEGEFLGGYPRVGSSVIVSQGAGGQWHIVSFAPSDSVFGNKTSLTKSSYNDNKLAALKPHRILGQVKDGSRFFLDPEIGFQAGRPTNYLHVNAATNIISHNLGTSLEFTEASRTINNLIRRDLSENANRNVLGSTLDSHSYESSLFTIGLDPTAATNLLSTGSQVRNPPLVETREIVYEFSQTSNFSNDEDEAARYIDPKNVQPKPRTSRREMRADALSLSLEYPNHLIETIRGTAVDVFGNILDLNRNALPIGKIDDLSLRKNPDKKKAFEKIRANLRKSIAFHFEINVRKPGANDDLSAPDSNDISDFARGRSKFSFDADKEGQFKLNVPASSETGNVPLLTRYENYSVLLSKKDNSVSPNSFVRPINNQDIYLENFSAAPKISLKSSDEELDGYAAPIDRITDKPIKLGTAYHDITTTCSEFLSGANYIKAGLKLVNFDVKNRLNTLWSPLEKIVSDSIIVAGEGANAGGRSGLVNCDGFLSINVGANTIDRQSIWADYAGSIISRVGRDKRGISYAAGLDGDLLLQIGGPGLGNSFDGRFQNENDAYRNGTLDIRVLVNGQLMIFRMGPEGISIISPGTITLSAQQDIIIKGNGSLLIDTENVSVHAGTNNPRIINKIGNSI